MVRLWGWGFSVWLLFSASLVLRSWGISSYLYHQPAGEVAVATAVVWVSFGFWYRNDTVLYILCNCITDWPYRLAKLAGATLMSQQPLREPSQSLISRYCVWWPLWTLIRPPANNMDAFYLRGLALGYFLSDRPLSLSPSWASPHGAEETWSHFLDWWRSLNPEHQSLTLLSQRPCRRSTLASSSSSSLATTILSPVSIQTSPPLSRLSRTRRMVKHQRVSTHGGHLRIWRPWDGQTVQWFN